MSFLPFIFVVLHREAIAVPEPYHIASVYLSEINEKQ